MNCAELRNFLTLLKFGFLICEMGITSSELLAMLLELSKKRKLKIREWLMEHTYLKSIYMRFATSFIECVKWHSILSYSCGF